MRIPESELIINKDGSIYHINLKPDEIAKTVIIVGDQCRVYKVSKHFDSVEIKKQKREFLCHTGICNGKEISVLSTGIGTDNIDIVLNELDALVNVDFETREEKSELQSLKIIRLGTSGCLRPEIPLDSILLSESGLGIDNLNFFYDLPKVGLNKEWERQLSTIVGNEFKPYAVNGSEELLNHLNQNNDFYTGTTFTSIGFYGPQGRKLRNTLRHPDFLEQLSKLHVNGSYVTNFEMETAGIYMLAKNLGHHALSVNVLIANRAKQEFSKDAGLAVEKMIEKCLGIICC